MAETWFGVRCVFLHIEPHRTYEERVTIWRAAISTRRSGPPSWMPWSTPTPLTASIWAWRRRMQPRSPRAGAEVFSLMRDSPLDPRAYLDRHFETGSERQQTEAE